MKSSRLLPVLLLLFVGSGCAALIYEVVWFQLLELVIGSSAVSMGSARHLHGRHVPWQPVAAAHHRRPTGIRSASMPVSSWASASSALALLFGMPLVGGAYTAWAGGGVSGILLRGVAAGVCLLPPTLLMGATLPAIARWVETTPQGVSWLGFFYGGNIAGAVVGSLLAGFYLLRVYDMAVATYVRCGAQRRRRPRSRWRSRRAAPYQPAAPASRTAVARRARSHGSSTS